MVYMEKGVRTGENIIMLNQFINQLELDIKTELACVGVQL